MTDWCDFERCKNTSQPVRRVFRIDFRRHYESSETEDSCEEQGYLEGRRSDGFESTMDLKLLFWTLVLCFGLLGWLYWDLRSLGVYYKWHDFLVDKKSGAKLEPRQLIDLAKIINVSAEYVEKTNALDRLYDQVYQTHLEGILTHHHVYTDSRELSLSAWPMSNQTSCGNQLDWINQKLKQHPDYPLLAGKLGRELSSLMDSFGKAESGTYAGLTFWVGSYSLCQRVQLDGGRIRTRYCVAKMRFRWWPQDERVYPKSRIRIGTCLPESCDTLSFEQHRDKMESLVRYELTDFYKTNLVFEGLHCLPDERSPIRRIPLGGQLLILLLVAWLSAIVVATIIKCFVNRRLRREGNTSALSTELDKHQWQLHTFLESSTVVKVDENCNERRQAERSICYDVVDALAFQDIWKDFQSDDFGAAIERDLSEGRQVRVDMRSMNLVKSIMTICILWGHSALLMPLLTRVLAHRTELRVGPWARFFMSFSLFVDTFFMLFGLLFAYTLPKKFGLDRLGSPLVWLVINAHIFMRVAPIFMLTYWFERLIAPYLGQGPWWDYGTYKYSMRGLCMSEPWYKSIPYWGQTGEPYTVGCNGPAWFLVSYTQIGLLLPLLVYVIYKLPTKATRLLLLLFLISIAPLQLSLKLAKQTTIRDDMFTIYGSFLATLLEKFESTGTMSTIGRVGPVAIGCFVGFLLRLYELGAIERWPAWLVARTTLWLGTVLQAITFFLPSISYWTGKDQGHLSSKADFIVSYTLMSLLWLALLSMQLINFFTVRKGNRLARFATLPFWRLFNKLGLCIYLIHFEVLLYGSTSFEQATSYGFLLDFWRLFGFGLLFSLPLAMAIYLLFELPAMRIFKHLLKLVG